MRWRCRPSLEISDDAPQCFALRGRRQGSALDPAVLRRRTGCNVLCPARAAPGLCPGPGCTQTPYRLQCALPCAGGTRALPWTRLYSDAVQAAMCFALRGRRQGSALDPLGRLRPQTPAKGTSTVPNCQLSCLSGWNARSTSRVTFAAEANFDTAEYVLRELHSDQLDCACSGGSTGLGIDAGFRHSGGMTTGAACEMRSIWGPGVKPRPGGAGGRGRPLAAGRA